MANVSATRRVEAPAEEVWARIGDFLRLHEWHPVIANCEPGPEPDQRTATMVNGREVVERLVDEGPLWHTYAPADESLGLRGYQATIRVRADGPAACIVEWTGAFEADPAAEAELVALTEGFYRAGLEAV